MTYGRANNYSFNDESGRLQGTIRFVSDTFAQGQLMLDNVVASELKTEPGDLGLVVSAILLHEHDHKTVSMIVLIPRLNVDPDVEAEPFDGIGVVLTQRTNMAGPAHVHGALETYDVHQIHGQADLVR